MPSRPTAAEAAGPVEQYLRLFDVASRALVTAAPLRDGEPQEGNFGVLIHAGTAFASDPGEGTIQMFSLNGLGGRELLISNHESPDGMAWTPVRVDVMVE